MYLSMNVLHTIAPAKLNLTLRVLGKRADGYHEIASVVAFANLGDELELRADAPLALSVTGPFAAEAGPDSSNLVLKAARMLATRMGGLRTGAFSLVKNLPSGAGLGGGSSDAAAALRLLAEINGISLDDARLLDAARQTGADVPVCVAPKARLMHGIGEILSSPLQLPELPAVIVFPGKPLATAPVFLALKLDGGQKRNARYDTREIPSTFDELLKFLATESNDLETAAGSLLPDISEVSAALESTGAKLVRMTGSGSAMFAIYDTQDKASSAAKAFALGHTEWWVRSAILR